MKTERRLIDPSEIIRGLTAMKSEYDAIALDGMIKALKEATTVDAVEVVHARWVDNHCTACGMMPMGDELWEHLDAEPPKMEFFMDYCPCCGAKMDRGTDND